MADEEDYYPCSSSSDLDLEDDDDEAIDCYDDDDNDAYVESDRGRDREELLEQSAASVITKESLLAAQKEVLQKAMDLLGLSEQHARTLLIYYRWDVERIFEMLEKKGRELLFSEAGVKIAENKGAILACSSDQLTCGICYDDVSRDEASVMDCGHYFCNDCFLASSEAIQRLRELERSRESMN